MKNKIITAILALIATAFMCGIAVAQAPKPVVKVNGTVLTEADLEVALNEIMPAGAFHGGFSSEKRASLRPQAIEKMIENELFYQEALKLDLEAEKEVEAERDKAIERVGGKRAFKKALKKAGLNDKKYRAGLLKKYLVQKIITQEVDQKAQVSDKEARNYYEKNREAFKMPEARRVIHIFVEVDPASTPQERAKKMAKAQEVLTKLKAGGDMSMLAWDYSEGPYRVKGGDMGFVHQGRLDPELEKAVFGLEVGKLSGIIETRYGYHIARVEALKAPEQLPYEAVSNRIFNNLRKESEENLKKKLIGNLLSNARIEKLGE